MSRSTRKPRESTSIYRYVPPAIFSASILCRSLIIALPFCFVSAGAESTALLKVAQIISCTTSGAAKLASRFKARPSLLFQGLSPKVMLIEEVGQTLEPHILATLSTKVEYLILIGDSLQLRYVPLTLTLVATPDLEPSLGLRPSINNYSLSVENPRIGSLLYRFDVSTLELLAQEGLPVRSSCTSTYRTSTDIYIVLLPSQMSQPQIQRRMRPEVSSLIK